MKKTIKEFSKKDINKKRARAVKLIIIPLAILLLIIPVMTAIKIIGYMLGVNLLNYFTFEGNIIAAFIIGLIGLSAILGTIIGLPLGIKKLIDADKMFIKYDKRSGQGEKSEIPEEIEYWNWGAAGLSLIWGICNKTWLSLLILIPYFNIIWIIVLGIRGNEWAWQNNKWESVIEFKKSQNKWKLVGILFFVINILLMTWKILSFV